MGAFKNIHMEKQAMSAMKNLYTDMELDRLREENEALREQVDRLQRLADQYLAALLIRAIQEPISEVANVH